MIRLQRSMLIAVTTAVMARVGLPCASWRVFFLLFVGSVMNFWTFAL